MNPEGTVTFCNIINYTLLRINNSSVKTDIESSTKVRSELHRTQPPSILLDSQHTHRCLKAKYPPPGVLARRSRKKSKEISFTEDPPFPQANRPRVAKWVAA